jgi:hypothetical protein
VYWQLLESQIIGLEATQMALDYAHMQRAAGAARRVSISSLYLYIADQAALCP